jgi:hypothetical protein
MHQVESHAGYHPISEPCERQWTQKARETDHRDFVKRDPVGSGDPLIGENVNVVVFVSGQTLGYLTGEPFSAAYQSVFGHDYSNFPAFPASNFHICDSNRGLIGNYTSHHSWEAAGSP